MTVKKISRIPSSRENPHVSFDKLLVFQIVREVEEGLCRKKACEKYGMAYATLSEWLAKFGSEDYQKMKKRSFSIQQRRNIARSIKEGRMTKREAALIYKIGIRSLSAWLRELELEDNELVGLNQQDMEPSQTNYPNTDLEKQLAEARLKIKALETMIDIAEEQFKISIRKKSGAKQSKG